MWAAQSTGCCYWGRWESGSSFFSGLPATHSGPQVLETERGDRIVLVGDSLSPFPRVANWPLAFLEHLLCQALC